MHPLYDGYMIVKMHANTHEMLTFQQLAATGRPEPRWKLLQSLGRGLRVLGHRISGNLYVPLTNLAEDVK